MNFRSLNINTKLLLSVATGVILGIIILVVTVSLYIAENMEKEAKDSIFLASKRYTNYMTGILDESVVLTKGIALSLNEMFEHSDQVNADLIESLVKNTFDSSLHAAYTFLYLKDTSVLSNTQNIGREHISSDGKTFAYIYYDEIAGKAGGIEEIKTPNDFKNLDIIQEVEKNAKYGDKDSLFVGPPTRLNYDGREFLGINFGMPIFNNKGKFVGVIGYTLDFAEVAESILDPKLDFFEGDLRFLTTDKGIVTVHRNQDFILKSLSDINKDPSAELVNQAVRERKDAIIDDYVATNGKIGFAAVSSFSTLNDSSHWSMVVSAPKSSILAPLRKLEFIFVGISIVILFAILLIVYFCVKNIIGSRIPVILESLENFFQFLNHKRSEINLITIRADDELGKMGKIINENILATKKGLEQDNQAVKESVETVSV
ncbi:TPA: cache domain-containing protein, partial [Campylobacter jejuni]|nr:cache domain-containing protein [Campylobacter jejuni]